MESNKDDSLKCLRKSSEYLTQGDHERALKFANKSNRLYPSKEADELISLINRKMSSDDDTSEQNGSAQSGDGVRQRRKSHSSTNGSAVPEDTTDSRAEPEYTTDQLQAVRRIKGCKNYYEILQVSKEASESDLKKSYRKMALQLHPDKCKAPGSTEAFKAVGNAYATLSDAEKRRKYDLYGDEEIRSPGRRRNYDYNHGFESEVTPEELFNMFFGGSAFNYSAARQNRPRYSYQTNRRREHPQADSFMTMFFQLSPIIMMVLISLLSIFLQGDDPYKFHRTKFYNVQRHTSNLQVQFFVKSTFAEAYHGRALTNLEREIENLYIQNLRQECYKEQMTREQLRWRAKYRGDGKAYEQAGKMEMKNCDRLTRIYGS